MLWLETVRGDIGGKMKQQTLEGKSSGKKVSDKKKEEAKAFKSKVTQTVTIAGFLSITKKFIAQIDRIVEAINNLKEENSRRNKIEQRKVAVLFEISESLKVIQMR